MEGERAINGVTFGSVHSDTYGLILASKNLGSPKVKTNIIDVPDSSISLDYTEAFGRVNYGRRTISMTFLCLSDWEDQPALERAFRNAVHGQRMNISFDDDTGGFYSGRVSVGDWTFYKGAGRVTVKVDAEPFRYASTLSEFEQYVGGDDGTSKTFTLTNNGSQICIPEVSNRMTVKTLAWGGREASIRVTSTNWIYVPELELPHGSTSFTVSVTEGTSRQRILFRWREVNL